MLQKFIRGIAMAEIYFVEDAKLYVSVADGLIFDIEKAGPRKNNHNAIVVGTFDATFDAIHAADGRLYLDGFALTDLMAWLHREMRNATFTAFGRRLFKFFPGSANISDLVRATVRCATGNEHQAHGEDAYYCRKVRDAHPAEFAELRVAWSERRSLMARGDSRAGVGGGQGGQPQEGCRCRPYRVDLGQPAESRWEGDRGD